jgi:lipopolysaccharide heptosyltransferase II
MRTFNKILVIRFSSLGDILLATPLLRVLRKRFSAAQIDFLVKKEYADLVRYNSHLSSVIELERGDWRQLRLLGEYVRKQHYDCIIDLHDSLRSRYVRAVAFCRHRNVVKKRLFARYALVHWKQNFYRDIVPVPDRYLATVKRLDVADDGMGLEIVVPDEIRSSVRARLAKYHLERYERVIGFAPAARHFTKRWPANRFVECGVQLSKNARSKILVFGGKEDAEYCGDIVHMINTTTNSRIAENLAAEFTILETAAAMDACRLIISNDTGLMHLAAARKCKVVAIFGSTVREFGFFPYRTNSAVIEDTELKCRPCTHIGREECPAGHFRCMKNISAKDVVCVAENMYTQ